MYPNVPIDAKLFHTVISPIAKIMRIKILNSKEDVIEALIEFESTESANQVKDKLHKQDMIEGGCQLFIRTYSKTEKLLIHQNDDYNWDFTKASEDLMGEGESAFYGARESLKERNQATTSFQGVLAL